jgi:Zn-finger nucleic acid-binding protein
LYRHSNGDWSKEGVDELKENGNLLEKTMWKETFRKDGEYWEKSSLTKRRNEDEETFENNRGYRKNKLRYFEDVLGLRIPTHEVL